MLDLIKRNSASGFGGSLDGVDDAMDRDAVLEAWR